MFGLSLRGSGGGAVMNARVVIIAAALFASGSAFAAEPAQPPVRQPDQAQIHRAEIVLASAEQVNSGPADQQVQPVRRHARVARVTTCRCGDQQDQPDQ
jgi:hypothetical protein